MAYTTIDDPEAYFQVVTYTGNGSADHAITLPGDTDMQPDLVWIKNRDAADSNCLFDSVRGATEVMHSDTQAAEATDADTLDSFTSDGFQVDADVKVNTNTEKYVAWCWKESATAGFDIVAYTGNTAGASRTIAHSLSAVPDAIILKPRSYEGAWWYVPRDHPAKVLELQNTNAEADPSSAFGGGGLLQSTFTSSVFGGTDGTSNDDLWNTNSATYIAYCFAAKQGFSKFGSYIGNGNADGTFVYTGFRPAFVMWKISSAAGGHWHIHDNKRASYNGAHGVLKANASNAEYTGDAAEGIEMFSNGWKPTGTTNNNNNYNGATYMYMAFAEAPFVNSNGVPCNAR